MRNAILLAVCCVLGSSVLLAQTAVTTYPSLPPMLLSSPPYPAGDHFGWNGAVPYAELEVQPTGELVLRVPADQPRVIAFDAADAITTGVLVVDGVRSEFDATTPAGGTVTAPPRAFSAGTHEAQVGVCNEFGCSPMVSFSVLAGSPPSSPTNPRFLAAVAAILREAAAQVERAQ